MHPVSPGSELVQGQESKNLPVTEMSLGHFVTDATTTTICFFNVTVQRMQRQQVCTLTWEGNITHSMIVLLNLNCRVRWHATHLYPYLQRVKLYIKNIKKYHIEIK